MAVAADISVFCTATPAKGGGQAGLAEGWVSEALMREVSVANPGARVRMAAVPGAADLVLDTKIGPGFRARLTWRGKPESLWIMSMLRGRQMNADDMAALIKVALQRDPQLLRD